MSQGSDTEGVVTVEADGVTVEKRFSADEFPVPAIEFVLRLDREEPTEFRLVDDIPADFPMDRIGFHPEYESEHWTAYQDHRVEYRRRLDPGEEVTTVYGIRTDDPAEGERFLGEPTVAEATDEDDPVGDVADVIGDDSSQAVRDVLASAADADGPDAADGDADDGGIDLAAAEADLGAAAAEGDDGADRESDDEATPDLDLGSDDLDDPESGDADAEVDADAGTEPEPAEPLDLDADTDIDDSEAVETDADAVEAETGAVGTDAVDDADETAAAMESDDEHGGAVEADTPVGGAVGGAAAGDGTEGVAAALAAELRAGNVSEADRETLTEELELNHSTSVDARIGRLQSKVEDVAAYADALEAFVDENGFAEEWMDGLQADLDELDDAIDETRAELDDAADERDGIRSDVAAVDDDVDAVGDDVAALEAELTETTEDLESRLEELRGDLDDVAEEVEGDDEAVADLREELADLGEEMESVSATVDDGLSEMRSELEEVHEELAGFEEFRERLSSVFGPGDGSAE